MNNFFILMNIYLSFYISKKTKLVFTNNDNFCIGSIYLINDNFNECVLNSDHTSNIYAGGGNNNKTDVEQQIKMLIPESERELSPEALLTVPGEHREHKPICKDSVDYSNLSDKFQLDGNRDVSRQYCKIYGARLDKMRHILKEKAQMKWGSEVDCKPLHELKEGTGRCVIIGTLFKHQELKPSILKEISEEQKLIPQPVVNNYVSDSDTLILEDELQRIPLTGNINISELVTGIVCAVLGSEGTGGKFEIEDICYAGLPEPVKSELLETDKFVIFVSGLELSDANDFLLQHQLLLDYITGYLGDAEEQAGVAKIARVIIAGNSLSNSKGEKRKPDKVKLIKELDSIITQIATVCDVDIMPGEFDPSNHVLPQQPLHRCLFPQASRYTTMHNVTNPYECRVGGRLILGSAGQNVDNIRHCTTLTNPLDVLERLISWRHIAPTAPDTLPCYPYYNEEPFVMDSFPDIVFAGNQAELSCRLISGVDDRKTLLLTIPRFNTSGTCALVNLRTLECQPLMFITETESYDDASSPMAEN